MGKQLFKLNYSLTDCLIAQVRYQTCVRPLDMETCQIISWKHRNKTIPKLWMFSADDRYSSTALISRLKDDDVCIVLIVNTSREKIRTSIGVWLCDFCLTFFWHFRLCVCKEILQQARGIVHISKEQAQVTSQKIWEAVMLLILSLPSVPMTRHPTGLGNINHNSYGRTHTAEQTLTHTSYMCNATPNTTLYRH